MLFALSFAGDGKQWRAGFLVLWVAIWWVTEVIPLGYTAFVPAVVLPLAGICSTHEVTACYLNPTITLFVQSFLLASAVHKVS